MNVCGVLFSIDIFLIDSKNQTVSQGNGQVRRSKIVEKRIAYLSLENDGIIRLCWCKIVKMNGDA